eukprot:TRINITY_DN6541_c0_g1_i2.p1 TRINITY_DN6541_c0_g1~~TRINITY_DN6541_c0_g1_i2.p1  ORF type:complete len:349 (-),score=71.23 TRINITY_DN6541_c0_g1_i2:37-1083(-)
MSSVSEIEKKKIKIQKAYIVSCVNSRASDLAEAAGVLRNRKVHPDVQLWISAASSEVEDAAKKFGDWSDLVAAGAHTLPPGCGPCIGLGTGLLEAGEVGISATNRNFKGRMGSKDAIAYLGSPGVVAASALNGYICSPNETDKAEPVFSLKENSQKNPPEKVRLEEKFPRKIEGEIVFCHQDNMNTDGIYPGKYTYDDNISPEVMATVAMENYDPNFQKLISSGDILLGGFNFGTGSSREQAATSLKFRGIPAILAGSFNETYKRNALNNGVLVIEIPELVRKFTEKFGREKLTVKTSQRAMIDFERSCLTIENDEFVFSPVGKVAQELIIEGGLENWIRKKIQQGSS